MFIYNSFIVCMNHVQKFPNCCLKIQSKFCACHFSAIGTGKSWEIFQACFALVTAAAAGAELLAKLVRFWTTLITAVKCLLAICSVTYLIDIYIGSTFQLNISGDKDRGLISSALKLPFNFSDFRK